ncbi:hypothetical protein CROQUDRAFT_146802 [Cronartium quercuum f. sp. fusiforme G11]|uniref:Uncharacterized protein n=1 Tax=Cronartium quercuum f. sp. fusiforme G11 TaxID=708437 RepID=A0A9P6NV32_9BASI|nr:hypothetical protein CROQUDRAFT_146802 [Cronartium quercuum f. sp. fusiforme G11]
MEIILLLPLTLHQKPHPNFWERIVLSSDDMPSPAFHIYYLLSLHLSLSCFCASFHFVLLFFWLRWLLNLNMDVFFCNVITIIDNECLSG